MKRNRLMAEIADYEADITVISTVADNAGVRVNSAGYRNKAGERLLIMYSH